MKARQLLAPILLAVVAAGCGTEDDDDSAAGTATSPTANACAKESLDTVKPAKLTIATDEPVYEPWFVDDDPANGKGFEGAIAYAVADELGFAKAEVAWTRVGFNAAIQPGPKKFDFDINEFSITAERRQNVDFSSPYYDVTQAVIAMKDSPAASATTLAGLNDVKIGAQVGTTSFGVIEDVIKPNKEPAVFNNNDDAKLALKNGQIDALVLDLPTAFYVTAAEITDAKIVGQVPSTGGTPEQFGLVLDKGSKLTTCVSQAVDALRQDGTLDRIEQQWLADVAGAPVLR